jgi:hypothetical protein
MSEAKTKKVKVIESFTVSTPNPGNRPNKTRYEAGQVVNLPVEMVDRLNGGVINTNMNTPVKVLLPPKKGKKK